MFTLKSLAAVLETYDEMTEEARESCLSLMKGQNLPPTHDCSDNDSITDLLSGIEGLDSVEPGEIRACEQKLDAAKVADEDGGDDDEDEGDADGE